MDFSVGQWAAIVLIFLWSGFVRTGIGFGGAALGLPLLLLVEDEPLLWLPAGVGHLLGLRAHQHLVHGDARRTRRVLGVGLLAVSLAGLGQMFWPLDG